MPQLPRGGDPRARVPPHLGSGLRPHHTVHGRLHLTFGDHDALPASKQHPESARLGRSLSAAPTCRPPLALLGDPQSTSRDSGTVLPVTLLLPCKICVCKIRGAIAPRRSPGRGLAGVDREALCAKWRAAQGAVLRGGARGSLRTPDQACMLRLQQGGVQPRGQPRGCSEPLGPRAEPLDSHPRRASERAEISGPGQRRPRRGSPNPGPSLHLSGHSRNGPRSRRADTARRRRRPGRRRNPACAPSPRPR